MKLLYNGYAVWENLRNARHICLGKGLDNMRYIISDIHGCYDEYIKLLDKIRFTDEDTLYILGDAVDRGPEPIKVLKDMMSRPNIIPIIGNHDFIIYRISKKLSVEVTEENYDNYLTEDDIIDYILWMQNSGKNTAEQFRKLSGEEQADILDYIAQASLYETLEQGKKRYILVHAGLANFSPDKDLDEYDLHEFLEKRANYSKRYYTDKNVYLVTGHTPTIYIKGWERAEVYKKNGHIAIDCGCVLGGKLAAYCIETEKVTYVEGRI